MPTYRITKWDERFENNRTRSLKKMSWVPLPNSHDGEGYTEIMSLDNGPLIYAAWVVILQVASKCETRGLLVRDNGKPHTAASLAVRARFPQSILSDAISVLTEVGWLEEVGEIPHEGARCPHEGAGKAHLSDYGTEGNGTERNGKNPPTPLSEKGGTFGDDFETF